MLIELTDYFHGYTDRGYTLRGYYRKDRVLKWTRTEDFNPLPEGIDIPEEMHIIYKNGVPYKQRGLSIFTNYMQYTEFIPVYGSEDKYDKEGYTLIGDGYVKYLAK